jgi:hypothetical protein
MTTGWIFGQFNGKRGESSISAAGKSYIGAISGKELISRTRKKDNNALKDYRIKWACPVIGEKVNCQNYL